MMIAIIFAHHDPHSTASDEASSRIPAAFRAGDYLQRDNSQVFLAIDELTILLGATLWSEQT